MQEYVVNNFALDRKIKQALSDLKPNSQWALMELPRDDDKELVADYILNWSNESANGMPMTSNTKRVYIDSLVLLARHHEHKKSFKDMTPEDFFSKEIVDENTGKKRGYLENIKRPFHEDTDQKWVNTYNTRGR